jgi:hypothetical protein
MKFLGFSCLVSLLLIGCTTSDSYVVNEPGPGGRVVPKRVKYSPEEMEERKARATVRTALPTDLAEIEAIWPKLTEEQRATVVQTVKQMAQPKE